MTPQLFSNRDRPVAWWAVESSKKYERGYWLESTSCFICQAGKASLASEPDWFREEEENKCVFTYLPRRQGKKENFSQIDKNIPSHSKDNEVAQCSNDNTFHLKYFLEATALVQRVSQNCSWPRKGKQRVCFSQTLKFKSISPKFWLLTRGPNWWAKNH